MIVRPIKLVQVANAQYKVCEPHSIAFYLLYVFWPKLSHFLTLGDYYLLIGVSKSRFRPYLPFSIFGP